MINFKIQLQGCLVPDYTCLGLCANLIGTNVDVEKLLLHREEKPKEELQKYLANEKRLESLVQVYIDDIHVIDILFVGHTM